MLTPLPTLALCAAGGFLLGSIPFGVIVMRLGGAGDLRKMGSGNIGATNVLRTGRRGLALLTLAGDGGKGAAAVLVSLWLTGSPLSAAVAGGSAFVGHLFPPWLGFRGGKGVATFFGTLIAIAWPAGLAAGATWIVAALAFRFSSLASLAAAALAPLYVIATHQPAPALWLALFMAVLIFVRHHENIGRLLRRNEPRIGSMARSR